MSIDNCIFVPAGARNKKQGDRGYGWTKYKSVREMPDGQKTAHQVFLAHQHLIDEQYFFEAPEDARWFWDEGYKGTLIQNDEAASPGFGKPMGFDRMALWICGEQVAGRGYGDIDKFDTETNFLPTGERRCDLRFRATDAPEEHGGTIEWARCIRPATVRIRVTPASAALPIGLGDVTYTPKPDQAYEAHSCAECYEATQREAGTEGNPAKVELVADSRQVGEELKK